MLEYKGKFVKTGLETLACFRSDVPLNCVVGRISIATACTGVRACSASHIYKSRLIRLADLPQGKSKLLCFLRVFHITRFSYGLEALVA